MRDYRYQIAMKDLTQYSVVYLIPLADLHIGCRDVDLDTIQGYIDWIRNHNNAFTILNGDLMNCAWKDSTPELYDDLTTPDKAYEQLRELLMPIRNRVLMITRGGHEESIYRKVGADYMARLAYDLGDVTYKPDGGMVGLRLGCLGMTGMCYAYAVHGWGGARTIGAKVKKARDLGAVANADIYVLSHDHTQNVNRGNVLDPPRNNSRSNYTYMKIRRKLYVNTGGFIKYSGYIQRKGYDPQDLGTPRIRIEFKKSESEGWHMDLHSSI